MLPLMKTTSAGSSLVFAGDKLNNRMLSRIKKTFIVFLFRRLTANWRAEQIYITAQHVRYRRPGHERGTEGRKLKLQDSSFLPESQSRTITIQSDAHAERTSRKSRHERIAPAKWALRVGRDKYRSSRTP